MKTSEQIAELAKALAAAQAEMSNATLNKVNPHFKSKYADLAEIRNTVTPVLAKHGLSVSQTTMPDNGVLIVTTRLMHLSGQWIESHYPIIADTNKPQVMGSAMTYARRYSLAAICNISADEDDDANEAAEHGSKPREMANMTGTPGASKGKLRANGDYESLVRELRMATSIEALKEWYALRKNDIDRLPPDWIDHLREDYGAHMDELKAREP